MCMKKYDYIIVGSGLFAGTFAYLARQKGKRCLVLEKRNEIGGNLYCEDREGIHVHKYGAHIFHTSNRAVWDFVNSLVEFNRYTNSPMANYHGEMYNMPFNMNTFNKMWGCRTPEEAKSIIEKQRAIIKELPKNLEEQAISLVGTDIYTKLIKGYTEKQWGRECKDLPAFIIKRLPVRYTYDNNYFNDLYQGIPIGGYNVLIQALFQGCDIKTGIDFNQHKKEYMGLGDKILYTGTLDSYYEYCFGKLEYRSLRFEREVPYTRIIEHKHFEYGTQDKTVITREYPTEWKEGMEPYYPVNDEKNQGLFEKYKKLADEEKNVIFGGRLAEYKYYDMDKVIASAFELAEREL